MIGANQSRARVTTLLKKEYCLLSNLIIEQQFYFTAKKDVFHQFELAKIFIMPNVNVSKPLILLLLLLPLIEQQLATFASLMIRN